MSCHDFPGELSAVEVFPYWADKAGNKHVVPGARVALFDPAADPYRPLLEGGTSSEESLTFRDIAPGKYVLAVYLEGERYAYEDVELLPGKRLSVSINAASQGPHSIGDAVMRAGEGTAEVIKCIFIGAAVVAFVALCLWASAEADADEEPSRWEFHFD